MSKGLRITFLVHTFVALIFGIALYLLPATWAKLSSWTPFDPNITRIFGAALLGIAVANWLGYRAARWDEVRILVLLEITFTVLGFLGGLYAALFAQAPVSIWLNIVVFAVFGALFGYFYRQSK